LNIRKRKFYRIVRNNKNNLNYLLESRERLL